MADEFKQIEAKAYREETLAALYFIGAAVAFSGGVRVLGWCLLAKGLLDTLSAIAAWVRHGRLLQVAEDAPHA